MQTRTQPHACGAPGGTVCPGAETRPGLRVCLGGGGAVSVSVFAGKGKSLGQAHRPRRNGLMVQKTFCQRKKSALGTVHK